MAKLTLSALMTASAASGFTYATEKDAKALVDAGHAEFNPAIVNPSNAKEFAVRPTDAGRAAATTSTAPVATKQTFSIATAPMPEVKKKNSGRTDKYPFDALPAPENGLASYFFVPATEKTPDPVTSLSSTISTATRRYAEITGQKPGKNKKGEDVMKNIYKNTRVFTIEAGEDNGVKGARIYRIQ